MGDEALDKQREAMKIECGESGGETLVRAQQCVALAQMQRGGGSAPVRVRRATRRSWRCRAARASRRAQSARRACDRTPRRR
eukprot:224387-Pleurochrysis_carterae.AAC.1